MTAFQTTLEKSQALKDQIPDDAQPDQPTGRQALAQWLALPELWLDVAYLRSQLVVTATPDEAAVPFDILRTRLVCLARQHGWRRIAMVSPAGGAGKTTTAVNLAFALGRQSGLRTLALDFDLRKPTMGRVLGARVPLNMTDLMQGQGHLSSVLRRHGQGMAFGLNDGSVGQSSEWLQSVEAVDLTARFEATYAPDLMLIDLPNLAQADDAIGFLPNVDAALIVVEAGRHSSYDIDVIERQVAEQTRVAGIVLNKCTLPDSPFGPRRTN
ncbi:AAA family ATPase [Pseudooceanicola sp. MF1-13]|uniref:nucleotide-binding protein n=1 Tax=Pseudooceanicola sp. MF1-13 TaxID=3379095 RepID=UPI003891A592